MIQNTRSQSQIIGSVLLVGLVVISVGMVGYAALDLTEPTEQPSADFEVDVDSDAESFTVDHRGGESIPTRDLTVQIQDESGNQTQLNISNQSTVDTDRFSAGNSMVDTETFDNLEGSEATVTVVHEPSGTIVERQSLSLKKSSDSSGPPDGNGTRANPYIIRYSEDLKKIKHNKSAHFILTRDIEGSIADRFNNGNGLAPIGSTTDPFTGSLDGNGYKIANLEFSRSSESQVGLFGVVGNGAEISDLTLTNTVVSGTGDIGALAGQNNGSVDNVTVVNQSVSGEETVGGVVGTNTGTIESTVSRPRSVLGAMDNVGGLVGINDGQLVSTVSETPQPTSIRGAVTGRHNIGGSVGQNRGTIDDSEAGLRVGGAGNRIGGMTGFGNGGLIATSSASSDVFDATGSAGGLVGESNNGTIQQTFATGSVSGGDIRGGLVGRSTGAEIQNSYAHTDITGGAAVAGGVVGFNNEDGSIDTTYATGTISQASTLTGGVVGDSTGTVEDSYWDVQSTGRPERIPFSEEFSGPAGDWTTVGDAEWGQPVGSTASSTLLLTDNKHNQVGLGLYDVSLQSRLGTVTEFDYYAGGGGSSGADGIAFFLVDGDQVDSTNIQTASPGGELGYTNGIPNAYLGIGFDEYGNFAGSADSVGIRAGADNNYDLRTSDGTSQSIDGGWRTARVTTIPDDDGMNITVEMSWDGGNSWETVISNYEYSETPPDNLKFGFSGATGGSTNFHAVDSVDVDYRSQTDVVGLQTSQMQGSSAPNYIEGFEASVWQTVENPDDYPELGSGQWDPSPIAAFDVSSNPATVDESIEFDASDSRSANQYDWQFGDGTSGTGTVVSHEFDAIGNYTVELTATGQGMSNTTTRTIEIQNTMDGDGTKADPYIIRDYHQLEQMDRQPDAHYRLGRDISPTLTADWDADRSFDPVGDSSQSFTGSFDGDGYEISGLTIDSSGNEIGLFGRTGSSAEIYNVSVTGAEVSGTDYVGVLVGRNGGTIQQSTTDGTVTGDTAVGGLAGMNTGTISDTSARGAVTGSGSAVGRLVGRNEGSGMVRDSYTTATVSGGSSTGKAVGNSGGSMQDVYWEHQSGQTSPVDAGQIGLTTDQMTGQAAPTYMAFDGGLWKTVSNDYPALGAGDWESNPRARFNYDPDNPEIRDEITFDASDSEDVKYYEWAFGDGATTGKQWSETATHDYDRPGTYTVKLTVHNADGTTDTIRNDVTVYRYPDASLTPGETLVTEGDTVRFDGSNSEPDHSDTEYDWTFGDGSTIDDGSSTERHSYSDPGDYEAELTVKNGAGNESTDTVSIEVLEEPTAEIDSSDDLITEGDAVDFTLGGGGSSPSLSGSTTLLSTAQASNPGSGNGARNGAGNGATVTWDFGNGQTGTTPSESVTYDEPGTYTVTLTVENRAGTQVTDTHTIEVIENPTATFTAPNQIKQGESLTVDASDSTNAETYQWNFGDQSSTESGQTAAHTYSNTGTYEIELTVENRAGTTDTTTRQVDVIVPDPVARFTISDSSVVRGDRISFDAGSSSYADSYEWQFGDGATSSSSWSSSAFHSYSEAGFYTVTLTVKNRQGVTDSIQKTVSVDQMAGSGTRSNPYQITDYHDLQAIEDDTSAHYRLENDIKPWTTSGWNYNTKFDSIYSFSGTLDGNQKDIVSLTVDGDGLFGSISSGGAVKNLEIRSADISGGYSTGILAGSNYGTVHGVSTMGDVDGDRNTGGLVGYSSGTIQDSWSTADISSSNRNVGGLVGEVGSSGEVVYSRAYGDAEGHKLVGGLIGRNSGEIRRSWAHGDATGNPGGDSTYAGDKANRIGGLVGEQNGKGLAKGIITNSYARGDASGESETGGLVGTARDDSLTKNSYSTGSFSVSDNWGGHSVGLALRSPNGRTYFESRYRSLSGIGYVHKGNDIYAQSVRSYYMTGENAESGMPTLDFDNVWRTTDDYPTLRKPYMNEPQ